MRSLGKIGSCEISFIPIESRSYVDDVDKVLGIIEASGLEHNVGILSTTIRGDKGRILSLIGDIYKTMDEICSFTMDVKLSNICGCAGESQD